MSRFAQAAAVIGLLISSQAGAYCFSPEDIAGRSAKGWARYIWKRADVIIDAVVIRSWRHPLPEQLRAVRVIKGPPQEVFTLASPAEFITAAPPSTGLPAGARGIVALIQGNDGYYVSECHAGPLGRPDVAAALSAMKR